MLKLDFLNKSYSLEEIIEAYTDGSINNFKGDEDFLTFLISYSLGDHLVGTDADKYKEYAEYDGILNIMQLDEYGYFGAKLYHIFEICGKDKIEFMRVCNLIGKYSIKSIIKKETIDKNLELTKPVRFIDHSIILSNGKIPKYNPDDASISRHSLNYEEEQEYNYELERSLRRRINESIKSNYDAVSQLEEMPSYVDKRKAEEQDAERKKVKDNHLIDIHNLYFGTQSYDISGGVVGMTMKLVSWFEYTNIDMLNMHVFRSIPEGDYFLLDDDGQIHIPDKVLKENDISVGPNSPVRSVRIANVPTIFNNAIKAMEDKPEDNEQYILKTKGLLEMLETAGTISVGEIENYKEIVRALYEQINGEIFPFNPNADYNGNPDIRKK